MISALVTALIISGYQPDGYFSEQIYFDTNVDYPVEIASNSVAWIVINDKISSKFPPYDYEIVDDYNWELEADHINRYSEVQKNQTIKSMVLDRELSCRSAEGARRSLDGILTSISPEEAVMMAFYLQLISKHSCSLGPHAPQRPSEGL